MSSLRHNPPEAGAATDPLLDAARDTVLAVGWRRSTLSAVARRAGVSRMTLYRRWPDMATLMADLMTREWGGLVPTAAGTPRARLVAGVGGTVLALREDALFAKILGVDPELLLPYLLERRGRTQDALLAVLEQTVAEGQADGSVRAGDPALLARGVLLASYGFVLSAPTMTGDGVDRRDLDAELRHLVDRHLAP